MNAKQISKQMTDNNITNELTIMSDFSDFVIRVYFVTEREFISLKDRFSAKLIRVI